MSSQYKKLIQRDNTRFWWQKTKFIIMETPIKLFVLSQIGNILRLQSQLAVGKDYATHILDEGVLKVWRKGDKRFQFYKSDEPYQLVRNIKEMKTQQL